MRRAGHQSGDQAHGQSADGGANHGPGQQSEVDIAVRERRDGRRRTHHNDVGVKAFVFEESSVLRDSSRQKDHVIAAGDGDANFFRGVSIKNAEEDG